MEPVYIDLHIHTSEDPNNLNNSYDHETLLTKVCESSEEGSFLISLTDHNTINKIAYLNIINAIIEKNRKGNIILGSELHIRKYRDDDNSRAYHCHIFFDLEEITEELIDNINEKLDSIYPDKTLRNSDMSIPALDDILDVFDQYDFLLLPHGGQTHSTFDETVRSTEEDKKFDKVLAKNLYYNFFDGFTSRSNTGIETTYEYFKRLGIDQFVGLITSSDNYNPVKYPEPKSTDASEFVPTWMFASPTYDGLRIGLSDTTRLIYSKEKPVEWEKSIRSVKLDNDEISINIDLTAGLNVIIGASSSGKTLLVDSINRKLNKIPFDAEDNPSVYKEKYGVDDIEVVCLTGVQPYYIHQNYISGIINTNNHINEIEPLNMLFPDTKEQLKQISRAFGNLKEMIENLFSIVKKIEYIEKEIYKIPSLANLITIGKVRENVFDLMCEKSQENDDKLIYLDYSGDKEALDQIHRLLKQHPLINHNEEAYFALFEELELMRNYSTIHKQMNEIIVKYKEDLDDILEKNLGKDQKRQKDFKKLLDRMRKYGIALSEFYLLVNKLTKFKKTYETPEKEINGHKLYFEGNIEISDILIKDSLNHFLLKRHEISSLEILVPSNLYSKKFNKSLIKGNQTGAVPEYSTIAKNIYRVISEKDQSYPKIETKNGENFTDLSPGKKTAVILDLIMSFKGDSAPIIIDQPEDNLSSEYMNTELIELIKKVKKKKQIIFVSHNATIPMIGDAQNVILCKNQDNKIKISSAYLEGKIDDKKVVDYIVSITDGGKQSVKKRFKKYNLKKFN